MIVNFILIDQLEKDLKAKDISYAQFIEILIVARFYEEIILNLSQNLFNSLFSYIVSRRMPEPVGGWWKYH